MFQIRCRHTTRDFVEQSSGIKKFSYKFLLKLSYDCLVFPLQTCNKKMDMLHFRDAVIDGMIEQNDREVLPAEKRMPIHRHHLGKNERPARNNRKKWRSCYENIQKGEGSVIAMCIECFNEKAFLNTFSTN